MLARTRLAAPGVDLEGVQVERPRRTAPAHHRQLTGCVDGNTKFLVEFPPQRRQRGFTGADLAASELPLARLVAEGLAEWDLFETTKGIARLRRLKVPE